MRFAIYVKNLIIVRVMCPIVGRVGSYVNAQKR